MSKETRHFSLLNVVETINSAGFQRLNGYWVQDHYGTAQTAEEKARQTEEANGNKIVVAVIEPIHSTTPAMNYWSYQKLADHSPRAFAEIVRRLKIKKEREVETSAKKS